MKQIKKKYKIFLGIIIFLIISFFISFFVYKQNNNTIENKIIKNGNFIELGINNLDKIIIKSKDNNLEIINKGNNFFIKKIDDKKEFLIRSDIKENIINKLQNVKVKTIVSDNPNNSILYGLDNDSINVILKNKDNKNILNFFIGKTGPILNSCYTRMLNDRRVILLSEPLNNIFGGELNDFRETKILNDLDYNDIENILVNTKEVDKTLFDKFKEDLIFAEASDFIPFDNNIIIESSVEILLKNKTKTTLYISKLIGDNYYVNINKGDEFYLVNKDYLSYIKNQKQ